MSGLVTRIAGHTVAIAAFLALWETAVRANWIDGFFFGQPSGIAAFLFDGFVIRANLWFGLGLGSKVAVGCSLTFFIMLSATVAGIRNATPEIVTLSRSLAMVGVQEEMGYTCINHHLPPDTAFLRILMRWCTPEQRSRYLEPYAGGRPRRRWCCWNRARGPTRRRCPPARCAMAATGCWTTASPGTRTISLWCI